MKRATANVKIDVHRLQQLWDIENAAGAVIERWESGYLAPYGVGTDPGGVTGFDALARAYRAAREPRTGEGAK